MAFAAPVAVSSSTLEGELAAVLRLHRFDARQVRAVVARLGWDGRGGATLRESAESAGYTRERVRQLEVRVRSVVSAPDFSLPLLDESIRAVEACAPDTRDHIARELWTHGLVAASFDPHGVLTAASVFGRPIRVVIDGRVVTRDEERDAPRRVALGARRRAARSGAASVVEVAMELGLEVGRTRRLLSTAPGLEWLDRRQSLAALPARSLTDRVDGLLRKVLSIAPALSLQDVDDCMRRAFRPVQLPLAILADVCARLDWAVVDRQGMTVASTCRLDPAVELTPVELALCSVFDGSGGVLSYTEIVRRSRGLGLNRNTVGAYLRHSPVIRSLERGRYVLRVGD